MGKKIINFTGPSTTVTWETLETMTRQHIQRFVQNLLEEEVRELLGRDRHERKDPIDAPEGYRNGYGKPRTVAMTCGAIKVSRPRVRGLEERFESKILPAFQRQTAEYSDMLPELYLHGLAERDFDMALRGILGDGAPLSASTVARLKEKWIGEKAAWDVRSLADLEVVYLWVDGVYVKAGLEKEKACVLTAIAGLASGQKVVVALKAGHRESQASWGDFLRDLRNRGMNCPRLIIGDGNLGIWGAVADIYPEADEQRCWNHRIVNVLDKLAKKAQAEGKELLKVIPYAETEVAANVAKSRFQAWARSGGHNDAAALIDVDWERMVTFYRYPAQHWKHIRTSNIVESPFATLRLRTDAAKRYKKVENATGVIWKMLLVAEKSFRKLSAPALMRLLYAGAKYKNGLIVAEETKWSAA